MHTGSAYLRSLQVRGFSQAVGVSDGFSNAVAHVQYRRPPQRATSPSRPRPVLVSLPLGLILLRKNVVLLVLEAGGGRFVDNDGRVWVELQNARGA